MLSERVRAHIRGLDDSRLVATASFILNYVIDNTESEADLGEMLTYVPEVFRAAGLLVVGPQLVALEIMEQLDHRSSDVAAI